MISRLRRWAHFHRWVRYQPDRCTQIEFRRCRVCGQWQEYVPGYGEGWWTDRKQPFYWRELKVAK